MHDIIGNGCGNNECNDDKDGEFPGKEIEKGGLREMI